MYQVSGCGFPVATKRKQKIQLHLLLSSYVSDLPDAEVFLSAKRRSQRFMPRHICTILKKNLSNCTRPQPRSLPRRVQTFQKLECFDGSFWCNKTLKTISLPPLLPTLSSILYVEIHSAVELYTISRRELTHVCLSGIRNMLEKCLIETFRDQQRKTASLNSSPAYLKPIILIEKDVPRCWICLLKTQRHSYRVEEYAQTSQWAKKGSFVSGLFTENRLIGMLQAFHLDSVNHVLLFYRAIVVVMCGNESSP